MSRKKPAPKQEMPDEYVPKSLRPLQSVERKSVEYACGYETRWMGDVLRLSYAMFAGPFPELEQALDCVPSLNTVEDLARREKACVIRFNLDGTDEVLYRWTHPRTGPGKWKRDKSGEDK